MRVLLLWGYWLRIWRCPIKCISARTPGTVPDLEALSCVPCYLPECPCSWAVIIQFKEAQKYWSYGLKMNRIHAVVYPMIKTLIRKEGWGCWTVLQFLWVGLSRVIIPSMRRKQLLIINLLKLVSPNVFVPENFLWRLFWVVTIPLLTRFCLWIIAEQGGKPLAVAVLLCELGLNSKRDMMMMVIYSCWTVCNFGGDLGLLSPRGFAHVHWMRMNIWRWS